MYICKMGSDLNGEGKYHKTQGPKNRFPTHAAAGFRRLAGAQALCLNADGSLVDSNMNTASIDCGLLPACNVQTEAPVQVSEPQEPASKPADETAQPVKKTTYRNFS